MTISDCIEWRGAKQSQGYGVTTDKGRKTLAHRAVWEKYFGAIPNGLHVLHKCDNPACHNIEHLFLGTPAENARDRVSKGRGAQGERHGRRKLTSQQVLAIRSDTRCQRDIAADYGVDQGMISKIKNRRNWTHL